MRSERDTTPTTASPRSAGSRLTWQHQIDSFADVGVLGDGDHFRGHDLADPASVRMGVGFREPAAAHQELDPARPLFVGSELRPAQKVALAEHPD
jgi:hypothetical protein